MEKGTRNSQYEEFKNFEELARKLLMFPKEELDEQRDTYQENKDKSMKPAGRSALVPCLALVRPSDSEGHR